MHVVFVSCCTKRARKRTRRILDGYANRINVTTWITPITMEALQDVRRQLNAVATRQTSVTCYRNQGYRQMKLLWTVGNRNTLSNLGYRATGTRSLRRNYSQINQTLLALTDLAGLTHDLGKLTRLFQSKLLAAQSRQPSGHQWTQDPVRHEWVSAQLVCSILEGKSLEEALNVLDTRSFQEMSKWPLIGEIQKQRSRFPKRLHKKFPGKLASLENCLLFAILSHHNLPSADKDDKRYNANIEPDFYFKGSTRNGECHPALNNWESSIQSAGELPESLIKKIENKIQKLKKYAIGDPTTLRALCIVSRAHLIMADHMVSNRSVFHSLKKTSESKVLTLGSKLPALKDSKGQSVYANTQKNLETAKVELNQTLDYHLNEVSRQAHRFAFYGSKSVWSGLPPYLVESLLKPSLNKGSSRFQWQLENIDTLINLRSESDMPILVLNHAETGSGKTRFNAMAMCALNQREAVRFTAVLGLRSLTLQTGEVFRRELGISPGDIAVVIGDHITRKLYNSKGANIDEDGNPEEAVFESASFGETKLPDYLKSYGSYKPKVKNLLAPPVLVATIDYLIAAGIPHLQAHHAEALVRLSGSDLIIDEVDNYEPRAFVAILRLVEMAAMQGSNIVTSSATLPTPMVEALNKAFQSGIRLWRSLQGNKQDQSAPVVFVDNRNQPQILNNPNDKKPFSSNIRQIYLDRIKGLIKYSEQQKDDLGRKLVTHKAEIIPGDASCRKTLVKSISKAISKAHKDHRWQYKNHDITVSFGLIRVAHIREAIKLAKELSTLHPHDYIACYHANELTIQRSEKEKHLDYLFHRKQRNKNIEDSEYIKKLLEKSNKKSVRFIVIATPIEEVGRDHDFDWAIIEPSSLRSIVQIAGRVNRHRRDHVDRPNIYIINHPLACLRGECSERIHFTRPGYETAEKLFPSHRMEKLINLDHLECLTIKLRFADSILSEEEDRAIETIIRNPLDQLTNPDGSYSLWMSRQFYEMFPLRSKQQQDLFRFQDDEFCRMDLDVHRNIVYTPVDQLLHHKDDIANSWLCWTHEELKQKCSDAGISEEEGLTLRMGDVSLKGLDYYPSLGFINTGS